MRNLRARERVLVRLRKAIRAKRRPVATARPYRLLPSRLRRPLKLHQTAVRKQRTLPPIRLYGPLSSRATRVRLLRSIGKSQIAATLPFYSRRRQQLRLRLRRKLSTLRQARRSNRLRPHIRRLRRRPVKIHRVR